MFARSSRVALALTVVAPSMAAAQGFEYTSGSGKYRITQTTKSVQEMMGQKQEIETSGRQHLTITLARAAKDTMALTVVLDSMTAVGPMGPAPGLERFFGVTALAKMSPAGAVYSVRAKDPAVDGATEVADAMGRFLPTIDRKLAKGRTWSDTTNGKVKQAGLDVDRRTISRFAVVGDTTVRGIKSWKVMRDDSTTLSGAGAADGQPMTMEGTAVGRGAIFLTQSGAFIGAEGGERSNLKYVLAATGTEITIAQTATTKIEKLK